jgi:hypothetical protein
MGLFNTTEHLYYNGSEFGGYQFISIDDLINNFIIAYVGEDKMISKIKRTDVAFHAQRALQELSYDVLRSEKSQEIEVSPALTMVLPHDYVNYVKLTWLDDNGIERIIYPAQKSSNPAAIIQDSNYNYTTDGTNLLYAQNSNTWDKFKSNNQGNQDDVSADKDTTFNLAFGQRYGIEPQHAQSNGTFFIDPIKSTIYFSSDLSGKTITLKYISDGVALDGEMQVHKFAEEAVYKHIAHAIVSTRANTPEYVIQRLKRERFAAFRTAKIRLSNIKLEEIAQVMRGKSKHIKH